MAGMEMELSRIWDFEFSDITWAKSWTCHCL